MVGGEHAMLFTAPGKVVFRFHARDLHLVLGPSAKRKAGAVQGDGRRRGSRRHARSRLDPPRIREIPEYRLYQLIRQGGSVGDRTFEIEFLDPGVQAFAFTFG